MDINEISQVASALADKIFVEGNKTAHTDLDGLKTAIATIDTAMNATTTQIQAVRPGEVLKLALLDAIRDAAGEFTVQDAGFALVLWVAKEVGFGDV